MPSKKLYDLSQCSEFRQTLAARPRIAVRVTAMILLSMVLAAITWGGRTEVDLVVRSQGRVRPMVKMSRLANSVSEENTVSPSRDGRIVKLHVKAGDLLSKGDVIAELDSARLQNDVARHERTVQAAEKELAGIARTCGLIEQRYKAATLKAKAELAQAESEIRNARERRAMEIKRLTISLNLAKESSVRHEQLFSQQFASAEDYEQAIAKFETAQVDIEKARLPIDDARVNVFRHALDLLSKDYAVELWKLESERQVNAEKLAATRMELANLTLELDHSIVRSPGKGTITSLGVKVGDVVKQGQSILAMVDLDGFRIDVSVKSEDIGHLNIGMPVRIKIDAYDYQQYGTVTGRIFFVSPDSSLTENAAQGTRPMYIVKIRLDADKLVRGNNYGEIKLGMTGTVDIVTDRENVLSLLVRTIRRSVSLG
jgi:HlyD family secretion protein